METDSPKAHSLQRKNKRTFFYFISLMTNETLMVMQWFKSQFLGPGIVLTLFTECSFNLATLWAQCFVFGE